MPFRKNMSVHKIISFIKSAIRLFGCFAGMLVFGDNWVGFTAFVSLAIAEVFGIIEEIGEK